MKKYLGIIILIVLLLGLAGSALAYPTIVQDYPLLKACENNKECKPGGLEKFGLPEYIKYIFIFALGTVGIIGLLAIIMAAFDYAMSAGNPQKAAAGKDKITSALLGMLLLLASWVLLNTVNPDLLKLKIKESPVKITVPAGETQVQCKFKKLAVDKTKIDAGQSVVFKIYWDVNGCKNAKINKVDLPIVQNVPGGNDDTCAHIEKDQLAASFPANSPFSYSYTPGKCSFECFGPTSDQIICNYAEESTEIFYTEGTIKIEQITDTGPKKQTYHIPRLSITVRDLNNDGTCCR